METLFTEEQLREKLAYLLDNLDDAVKDDDKYNELIWQGLDEDEDGDGICAEDDWAVNAAKYPDLHPMMQEIVTRIAKQNYKTGSPLTPISEWSAGAFFATRLALANEAYIPLFVDHFLSTDPSHEECTYQFWGIYELIEHYGVRESMFPVLLAPYFVDCSLAIDFMDPEPVMEYLEEGERMDAFLKTLAQMTDDYIPYLSYPAFYMEELFSTGFLSKALGADDLEDFDETAEELVALYRKAVKKDKKVPTIADIKEMIGEIA